MLLWSASFALIVPKRTETSTTVAPGGPSPYRVSPLRRRLRRITPVTLKRVYRLLRGVYRLLTGWGIGDRLSIGRHSYGEPLVRVWKEANPAWVRIGNFVCISEDVVLMLGSEHRTDRVSTFPFRIVFGLPGAYEDGFPYSKGDIVIGSDVLIGRGARILSGVKIEDGAVIAASALVAKDVRPYAIVGGNPAREIRRRFSDEQIEALLRIRWWDWADEEIIRAVPLLNSAPVEEFIERYDPTRGGETGGKAVTEAMEQKQ